MAELWFPPHLLSQFSTMIITDRFFFISPRLYQRSYKQSLRNLTIIDYWSGWSALDLLGLDFFRTLAGHFWTFTGASLSDSSTVLNFDLWTFDLVSSSSGFFFSSWCFHYHQLPTIPAELSYFWFKCFQASLLPSLAFISRVGTLQCVLIKRSFTPLLEAVDR